MLKRPPARRGLSDLRVFWALGCLLSAALWRIYVCQDTVQLGYALAAAQQRQTHLQRQLGALHVRLAAARTPQQLMRTAQHLGLQAPHIDQVVSGVLPPSRRAQLARVDLAKARHARR